MDTSYQNVHLSPSLNFARGVYPPAVEYANQADRSHATLVEAFRNMHVDEEELLENGDSNLEVCAVFNFLFF